MINDQLWSNENMYLFDVTQFHNQEASPPLSLSNVVGIEKITFNGDPLVNAKGVFVLYGFLPVGSYLLHLTRSELIDLDIIYRTSGYIHAYDPELVKFQFRECKVIGKKLSLRPVPLTSDLTSDLCIYITMKSDWMKMKI